MRRRTGKWALAATAAFSAAALAGGCASSTPENAPEWYLAHLQSPDADKYPRLEDVPRGTVANVDSARWDAEQAALIAEMKALKAHPRSEPAGAEDPAAFDAEARAALEAARAAH